MGFFDRLRGDITYLRSALRALRLTTPIAKNPTRIFPNLIEDLAEKYGDAPALLSERETFTYRTLVARSNRYARWALEQGLQKGDTICLLMPNRPEYMAAWLGITRVGGVVAMLNTNLTGPSLAHCINIVAPKHVLVAGELYAAYRSAEPHVKADAKVWMHGDGDGDADLPRLDLELARLSDARIPDADRPPLTIEDRALFIYTSGTTGLPKAANINHYRLMLASLGFAGIIDTKPSDRMYVCLPMYHTVGGVIATGAPLVHGGSVFIRERFSAREFWDDVVKWDCTLFQYIGELCRYLVNSPPHPKERQHKLRVCCGNGLRPDVWTQFQERFQIPHIIEFYAATEGNCTMVNFEGKPGAIGRIPWFVAHRFPTAVVKFDVDKAEPIRGADGFCIPCAPNEPGEVLARIVNDPSKPANRFEGYASAHETERKILRDVFAKGDAWFRTGDLMRKDSEGFFYFVDRIGDTFRWKGENVATSEVAETMTTFPGVREANVYGVNVAGRDGRAGMAAIVVGPDFDLAGFRRHLVEHLPDYARPLFLRLQAEMEVTGTFKQRKVDLVRQGFDPAVVSDPLYFNDPETQAFMPIDAALYDRIQSGQVRL